MIVANELRIGNRVYFHKKYSIVSLITPIGVQMVGPVDKLEIIERAGAPPLFRHGYLFEPFDSLYPIPLTEEILLRCGFEKLKDFSSTFIMEIETYALSSVIKLYAYLDETHAVSYIRLIQGNNSKGNMLHIKSLHQLQNLYFALTGKELEVKL